VNELIASVRFNLLCFKILKMKNKLYKYISFLLLIIAIGFNSCSSDQNEVNIDGHNSMKMKVNSTETMEISTVEFNSKNRYFSDVINNILVERTELIIDEAVVVNNSWSPYSLIAIPYKNNPNKFYSFYGNHSLSKPFIVEGTLEEVYITSVEGKRIGQILNKRSDKIFNDFGFSDLIQDNLQPVTNSICDCHGVDSCENHQYDRMQNCGVYDFDECMTCAEDVCDQDTKCRYGRTWTGPLYVISVAVHCAI